jgi:hypothetical protein
VWDEQCEPAKATIAEIEGKIALQTQRAEQLRSENKDASVPVRLIFVLQESLARAKTYAEYIEQELQPIMRIPTGGRPEGRCQANSVRIGGCINENAGGP